MKTGSDLSDIAGGASPASLKRRIWQLMAESGRKMQSTKVTELLVSSGHVRPRPEAKDRVRALLNDLVRDGPVLCRAGYYWVPREYLERAPMVRKATKKRASDDDENVFD